MSDEKKAGLVSQQALRFGLVGIVGFIVNASIVEELKFSISPIWAQAIAFPIAATITWWLNRKYTFGVSQYSLGQEWLRYLGANTFGWCANNGTYLTLIILYPVAYGAPSLAVAAGSLAGMLFNFFITKRVVFKA